LLDLQTFAAEAREAGAVVLNTLHAELGDNGFLQAYLEQKEVQVLYTGSDSQVTALCHDKVQFQASNNILLAVSFSVWGAVSAEHTKAAWTVTVCWPCRMCMYLYPVGSGMLQQLAECMMKPKVVCTVVIKRATASFPVDFNSCCLLCSGGIVGALEDTGGVPHLHYSQVPPPSASAVCCSH
jgi:hypothetical protein